ncbi:MAG: XRE family transcriptional regulator [Hyphomicrobiales bacterium]|nr:MAG: XRE family transcriptional regulator [Hyphomicrobiales bacterium]
MEISTDQRIAERLKLLRNERQWSLDDLAQRSTVSRATLSRLENGDVSPTTNVLGKLCAAFGLTLSRLMHMVEDDFTPLITRNSQPQWHDENSGFKRRSVSPPAQMLAGEVLECELAPDTSLSYDNPPRPGLEHHLMLVEGRLEVTIEGICHAMVAGDCLRYQLTGASLFKTADNSSARYFLFIV